MTNKELNNDYIENQKESTDNIDNINNKTDNYDKDKVNDDDWNDEIRLGKIDEVMKRAKLSFNEAKDCLEAFDYDIVETLSALEEERRAQTAEAKQKLREKYNDAKDFGKEKYEDIKDFSKEKYADFKDFSKTNYHDLKRKMNNFSARDDIGDAYKKVKDVVGKPVGIPKTGKKLPAGILGAGAVSLLYPLHKSKVLAALGIATIGAWAVGKKVNNEEVKTNIKSAVDTFSRNVADSFKGLTGDDDNCFIITVDDDFQPKNIKHQ